MTQAYSMLALKGAAVRAGIARRLPGKKPGPTDASMDKWMLLVTGLGSVAATATCLVSWWMVREAARMRLAQSEPSISLHLDRGRHLNLMNLVIQNQGQGTAYDLRWEVGPSPEELKKHRVCLESLRLLDGFTHLAPQQRIETFFGNAPELLATKCPPVVVTVWFRNARNEQRSETFALNSAQFEGITEAGEPPMEAMARSLERIVKLLERISPHGRVRVAAVSGEKSYQTYARQRERDLETEMQNAEAEERLHQETTPQDASHTALTGSPAVRGSAA